MDWFLYDNGLCHERVKGCSFDYFSMDRLLDKNEYAAS